MDDTVITLAGKEYPIPTPLTLGQIIDLKIAVVRPTSPDPQEEMRRSYQRSIDIIAAALGGKYPEITTVSLPAMPISDDELTRACNIVLDISGLIPKKDAKSGEAQAGAQ